MLFLCFMQFISIQFSNSQTVWSLSHQKQPPFTSITLLHSLSLFNPALLQILTSQQWLQTTLQISIYEYDNISFLKSHFTSFLLIHHTYLFLFLQSYHSICYLHLIYMLSTQSSFGARYNFIVFTLQ